jgi:hypothetical protein
MQEAFRRYGKMRIYTGLAIAAASLIDTLNFYIKLPSLTLGIGHGGTENYAITRFTCGLQLLGYIYNYLPK